MTGVQTCALPIYVRARAQLRSEFIGNPARTSTTGPLATQPALPPSGETPRALHSRAPETGSAWAWEASCPHLLPSVGPGPQDPWVLALEGSLGKAAGQWREVGPLTSSSSPAGCASDRLLGTTVRPVWSPPRALYPRCPEGTGRVLRVVGVSPGKGWR